jgi:hypothetical protein
MKVGVVVAVVLRCSRSLTNVVGRGAEDDQRQALLRVLHKPKLPPKPITTRRGRIAARTTLCMTQ